LILYVHFGDQDSIEVSTLEETAVKMNVGEATVKAMLNTGLLHGIIVNGETYILPSDYLFEKENNHE
jgi:hypothetical protein